MNSTTLSIEQCRALILVSAKDDVRYYLNGFLVDFENRRAVATDGHCLLAMNITSNLVDVAYGSAIVPRDAIETLCKGGKKYDTVDIAYGAGEKNPDFTTSPVLKLTRSNGQQVNVAAIDGRFPEYQRVIPDSCSGEPGQYNPELLARICKALRLAVDAGPKNQTYVDQNGGSSALVSVHGYSDRAIAVVMPWRAETDGNSASYIFFAEQREQDAA